MLSLPEMLRPVNAGMQDADTGLCTVLSGRLTGMLPTEARKALILKDILSVPVPLPFSPLLRAPWQLCAAYGLEMRVVTKWLPLWASFKAASRQKECGTLISLCAGNIGQVYLQNTQCHPNFCCYSCVPLCRQYIPGKAAQTSATVFGIVDKAVMNIMPSRGHRIMPQRILSASRVSASGSANPC